MSSTSPSNIQHHNNEPRITFRMKKSRTLKITFAVGLAALCNACMFYPRTYTVYDEECKMMTKKMELGVTEYTHLSSCSGDDCIDELFFLGFVGAVSAVVSGTVVVSGNMVYWMEKQMNCENSRTS